MRRTPSSELLSEGVELHFSTTSRRFTTSTLGQQQGALSLGPCLPPPASLLPAAPQLQGKGGAAFVGLPRPKIFGRTQINQIWEITYSPHFIEQL